MLMPEKKYRWIKVAESADNLTFGPNHIAETEIEGKNICIVKTASGLKACAAKCPHAGGNMAEGKIDQKGNIVCPVHGYIFNLNNGRDLDGEGYFLKIYPVRQDADAIFIGIEEQEKPAEKKV